MGGGGLSCEVKYRANLREQFNFILNNKYIPLFIFIILFPSSSRCIAVGTHRSAVLFNVQYLNY